MLAPNIRCPYCKTPVREFYVPPALEFTGDPAQRVCRCPHCHTWIDKEVEQILDYIIQEQRIQEWVWEQRMRLIKLVESADDLLEFWGMLPEHASDESGESY